MSCFYEGHNLHDKNQNATGHHIRNYPEYHELNGRTSSHQPDPNTYKELVPLKNGLDTHPYTGTQKKTTPT